MIDISYYDSTSQDWVPSLKVGYEVQIPEQHARLEMYKRKRQEDADVEDIEEDDEDIDTGIAC